MFLSSFIRLIKQNLALLLILVFTFIVYSPVLENKFVWDDIQFIVDDQNIRSWKNFPLLIKGYLPLSQGYSYRPLRSIFFNLFYQFFDTHEIYYHLLSIFIHLSVVVLNFLIAFKITKNNTISLLSACILAFHPVNIESITWVSSSFNTIGNIFFYLSFYLYLVNLEKNKPNYFFSYVFACLAYLTNEITYSLPLVLVAYDLVFVRNKKRFKFRIRKICLKYFYILGIIVLFRSFVLADLVKIKFVPIFNSVFFSVLLGLKNLMLYFRLLIFPFNQTVNHIIHKDITNFFFTDFSNINLNWHDYFDYSLLAVPFFLILFLLCIKKMIKKIPFVVFFFLVFIASLLPVLNIIPSFTLFSERYLHISLFFFSLTVAYYFELMIKKYFKYKFIFFFLYFSYILYLGFSTFFYNKAWYNEETLWNNVLKYTTNSARANSNLGLFYFKMNKNLGINYLKKAVSLNPNYGEFSYKYAMALIENGEIEEAKKEFLNLINKSNQKFITCKNIGNIFGSYELFDEANYFYDYCKF